MAVGEAGWCRARTYDFLSDRLLPWYSFMDSDTEHSWQLINMNKNLLFKYLLMFSLKRDNFTSKNRILFSLKYLKEKFEKKFYGR
jgi:hypothetical protein